MLSTTQLSSTSRGVWKRRNSSQGATGSLKIMLQMHTPFLYPFGTQLCYLSLQTSRRGLGE